MNWFGKKKKEEGSTVSASSARPSVSNPQATIVKLRENIRTQDKRLVLLKYLISVVFFN